MKNKTFSYWQNVVFTDETLVRLPSDGFLTVLRKIGTRNNVENLKKVSRDKRSLMFWRAIRFDGPKMLIKCLNDRNSDEYLKVLQKYQENLQFDALVYQRHNAPIHKAKKIMDYFAEKTLLENLGLPGI